jgi:two-component system, NarL family, response regulator DevR
MMNTFLSSSDNREMSLPDRPLRVLIVDDHEIFRHGLRDLINSVEGFQVVAEAGSCKNALALAEQRSIDLVVLDMYLPDGDGIEVTRQLRQQVTPPPRVIILSAVIYDDTLVDAILAGAQGYLTKDMPASDIVNALKGFQRGELALLPTVTTNLVQMLVQKYSEAEAELSTQVHNNSIIMTDISTPQKDESPNTAPRMLTSQEDKVFRLLRQGKSNKQIASKLAISPYTVGKHVQNILRKLGVTNRTQAASYTSFEGDNLQK